MNAEETSKLLAVLTTMWPSHPVANRDALIVGWQMAMDDVPYEAAMAAAREWLKTGKFFPAPSELRAIILERLMGLPSPEEAWGEVMSQVRAVGSYGVPDWSCLALYRAVNALGWREICLSERVETTRAHFFRTYQSYRERALREANLPALWSGEEGPPRLERGDPVYRSPEERGAIVRSKT